MNLWKRILTYHTRDVSGRAEYLMLVVEQADKKDREEERKEIARGGGQEKITKKRWKRRKWKWKKRK